MVRYLRTVKGPSSCIRREVEQAQDSTFRLPRTMFQDHRYPTFRHRARHYREPTVICRPLHHNHRYFIRILIHHSTIRRRSRRSRSSPLWRTRHISCERRVARSQAFVQDLNSGWDVRISSCVRLALRGAGCERYG